jgi:putative transposase
MLSTDKSIPFVVEGEGFVEHKTTGSREPTHITNLFAVRSKQFEWVALPSQPDARLIWSMANANDFQHGRHVVFAMHVHLVFVMKYRRCTLDGEAIEQLRQIFSKVCTDFEAVLVQMDSEGNHVPRIAECYWKNVLWSPSYFAASCGGAPLDLIKRHIDQQATHRYRGPYIA